MSERFRELLEKARRRPWRALLVLAGFAALALGGTVGGISLWSGSHYRAARQALERGDFDRAQEHLNCCLKVRPGSALLHLLAAQAARRRDACAEAEQHLTTCERLQGVTPASTLERALLRAQQGDLAGVEAPLQALAAPPRGHPERAQILEALAKGYLATYRLTEALHCLDTLLRAQPGWVPALLLRARARKGPDRNEKALADYQRAVELAPESDAARLGLAETLYRLGRVREATAHFEILRARDEGQRTASSPSVRASYLVGLARCRHDNHELEAAEQLLDTLLAEQPDAVAALVERGRLAFRRGHAAAGERWLRRAVAVAPEDRDAHFVLHLCLEAQGKAPEARQCLARLREIEARTARETRLLAQLLESPHDPALRYEIGMIFLDRGQAEEGLLWLAGALQEDPRHAATHAALADYFERTGQSALAARHRQGVVPAE